MNRTHPMEILEGAVPADRERFARMILCGVAEPGDRGIAKRVASIGPERTVRELVTGRSPLRRKDSLAAQLAVLDPVAMQIRVQDWGGRVLIPGDLEWPTQLDDLGEARPIALWVRGVLDLRMTALFSVGIVGSRACTAYGSEVAAEFAADLADRGWAVISGGAYGIDAAAHRGALAASGSTVAVVASGVDVASPRGHDALFSRIADEGLIVSEVPPGSQPNRTRFLVRNRLIAALTRGTLVVEAALRSGALSTATWADELNRVVMGVPGPVTSAASSGVHERLRTGAILVTRAAEVIEAVGSIGDDLAEPLFDAAPGRAAVTTPEPGSGDARVLDALPLRGGASTGGIAASTAMDEGDVMAVLGRLELLGLVCAGRSGWRRARDTGPEVLDARTGGGERGSHDGHGRGGAHPPRAADGADRPAGRIRGAPP